MLHQRIFGLEYAESHCESDYILCLDDDVAFNSDYAETAHRIINYTACDMLMPTVLENGQKHLKIRKLLSKENFSYWLRGIRGESRSSRFRVAIMKTGGFKTNTALKGEVPTQSCHGTGFWIRNGFVSKLDMKSEYWVEHPRYALPEDQVFGYKAFINGAKMIFSTNISHIHLDAGSSTAKERMYHSAYASGRNYIIFWHRFIFSAPKKHFGSIRDILAISHRVLAQGLGILISGIVKRDLHIFKGYCSGVRNGIAYISSDEYMSLHPAKCN